MRRSRDGRRGRRAGDRRASWTRVRPAEGVDEPDRDQGGAEPARPRRRRVSAADGRCDGRRARRRCARCLERLGLLEPGLASSPAPYTQPDGVRIIPLGGLGEVGKNMTVFESRRSDRRRRRRSRVPARRAPRRRPRPAGLRVSPRAERRSARVVLTHGHEDHVGSLPYLMREVRGPEVCATRLTLGLIKSKLDEHGLLRSAELREVDPDDDPIELGPFRIEFVRMAHSIPDAVAVVLETPAAGSSTRATTSSTTRRSTACAPTSASSPRSATAASTCCSATRRTPSGPASRSRSASSARHSARSSRGAQGRDPRLVVRLERAPDAAGGRRRRRRRPQGRVRRPLDAQELEHRAQPRLHGCARGRDRQPARARGAAAATSS